MVQRPPDASKEDVGHASQDSTLIKFDSVDVQFSLDGERLAFAVRPECGERDFKDNHVDANPDLMRLIMGSDDILEVSSEPVFDRWKKPL